MLYEFLCTCNEEQKFYTVSMSLKDYKSEIACPCGKENAMAKRVFNVPAVHHGMTANEKIAGTKKERVEYGKFMKDQREIRKKEYGPETREGVTNELWTGNEGLDGVTKMPIKSIAEGGGTKKTV